MREEENHLCGLSRLSRGATAGLGCPVLGFLRTRTSQNRALWCAGRSSVSCVPYLSSRSLGIAGFSPSQNGDRGKNGEVVRGYVACDLTDRTPKQVEALYHKRSAIETSYRTYREARAITAAPDPLIRFIFVAVSFLLRNLWLVVRWAVVARPQKGGRDLPTEFTFELVCGWIRDHLSDDLGWQYTWETNGVGLPPAYGAA